MKLVFPISSNSIIEAYSLLRKLLGDNELIIFKTMEEVSDNIGRSFDLPFSKDNYESKHDEIKKRFSYLSVLSGREIALKLFLNIFKKIEADGGLKGISTEELKEQFFIKTEYENVHLVFKNEHCISVEWNIEYVENKYKSSRKILLDIIDDDFEEIIPPQILEYIHNSISSYSIGMNYVAVALMSIVIEGTLRDALEKKGYSFNPVANKNDVYKYTKAKVKKVNNYFKVEIQDTLIKETLEFPDTEIEIEMRRVKKKESRSDILIKNPKDLIEFWTKNEVDKPGEKTVTGLGAALSIARKIEILTPAMLPTDFDDIIKAFRNNLIHLSSEALKTPILSIDPSGNFTLNDVIKNDNIVLDLVANIPTFVNDFYKNN